MVLAHAFALVGLHEPSIGNINIGGAGVWVFFILSGYLISASWQQYPRFNVYLAKRALRIFPGLIVAVALSIVVCGLAYSTLGVWDYFTNSLTLSYLNNIFLFNTSYSLPGVFSHNVYPTAVNGSLWTLAYEFTMYLLIAAIGVLGITKKVSIAKIWTGLFITELIITIFGIRHFGFTLFYLQFDLFVMLALMFFTGVLVQKWEKKIPMRPLYGLLSLALFLAIVTLFPRVSELAASILLAYALFSLGSSQKLSWFGRYGDFSYGIYIYSFPIQQMVVASTHTSSPYKLFLVSWPLSIIIGAASWWFVESRFLKLKTKINLKKYPLSQVESVW